ncbi:MAG: hypothetical protein HY457_00970 [Parcubacteria group bacterium]|nr:hypothetical protein [Parcubacteria group bacterium]
MFAFLARLQKKPPAVRLRIALGAAFVVTLAVALVWGFGLSTYLMQVGDGKGNEDGGILSPFEIIKSEFESVLQR